MKKVSLSWESLFANHTIEEDALKHPFYHVCQFTASSQPVYEEKNHTIKNLQRQLYPKKIDET